MNLSKLKDQKGITGVDIVIAISIISITTVAIMAIYLNIVIGSKKVTRTSAATRIATSILENIESMYYAEVEHELIRLSNLPATLQGSYSTTATYDLYLSSDMQENVFHTKLNPGYNVELVVNEISKPSSINNNENSYVDIKDCPLVLDIKVIVKYQVSNREEELSLKTIKKRELLQECNEPNINDLLGQKFDIIVKDNHGAQSIVKRKVESLNQVEPIKWSSDTNTYIRTNKTNNWYSYLNKEWARVAITGVSLGNNAVKAVFDTSSDSVIEIPNQTVFIWLPRFGVATTADQTTAFSHSSSNYRILDFTMSVKRSSKGGTMDFRYNGVVTCNKTADASGKITSTLIGKEALGIDSKIFPEGSTGVWLDITGGKLGGIIDSTDLEKKQYYEHVEKYLNKTINKSSFGPPVSHVGKEQNKYY
ncbi:MAG: hypothetical protein J6J60_04435 [Clostridia bacterium]|nr:hypothetical protein [Clostridia bacterium]